MKLIFHKSTIMKRSSTQMSTQTQKSARTSARSRKTKFSVPRYLAPTKTGFPKQLKIKHRYCDSHLVTTGLGTVSTFQFSVNGLFDPNIGGSGHQPMYFDQLTAVYNHYTVTASKITVQFANQAAAQTLCGVYVDDDTSITPASAVAMCEQNSASFGYLTGFTATRPLRCTKTWNAVQAFGPGTLANDDLQGTSASNPVEQQYYTCFVQDALSGAVASVLLFVTIEYEAVWDELKNLASS